MIRMSKAHDMLFRYAMPHRHPVYPGSPEGVCRLRVYRDQDRPTVIVMTELRNNPGPSVTQAAPAIAERAIRWFHLDPTCILWIEHIEDRFQVISFYGSAGRDLTVATWSPMSPERLAHLIGAEYPAEIDTH